MKKFLTASLLIAVLLVGLIGSTTIVQAANRYKSINLSKNWTDIAISTSGFNCNVTISCLVTGTDGLGAIRADVRMLNSSGTVVWSESKSCPGLGSRTYWCGSNVYKVQVRVATGGGTARAYSS